MHDVDRSIKEKKARKSQKNGGPRKNISRPK